MDARDLAIVRRESELSARRDCDQGSGIRDQGSGIRRVLAVAGIANPERFVSALKGAGWNVVDAMTFRDHHPYSAGDVAAIAAKMRSAGANVVFTTDKDAVRFEALGAMPFPLYRVPLEVEFDPAGCAVCFDQGGDRVRLRSRERATA